jgi:hypothetical protein
MWEKSFVQEFLVTKSKGKRPFERPKHGCKDNMDAKEVVWEVVDN